MNDAPLPPRRLNVRPVGIAIAILAAAVAVLAACGGGSSNGSGSKSSTTAAANTGGNGGGANGVNAANRPTASGQIAEIDANTVQVQSQQAGQVAVDVTAKTSYSQTQAMTLAAVKVGSCIVATSTQADGNNGDTQPTAITADDIVISTAVNGSCTRGFGAAGGSRPQGSFTGVPSGFRRPSGAPTGANGQLRRALGTAGLVTGISGGRITVKAERRAFPSATSTPAPTSTPASTVVVVTVTASTKYSETVSATKAAMKVGLCMTAFGTTASDGTVTANRVALSPATSGGCDQTFRGGFAGGGFGGGGGAGGPGGAGTVTTGG